LLFIAGAPWSGFLTGNISGNMNKIYLQIPDRYTEDPGLILATVTAKNGSTPQEPGSSALFNQTGLIAGTIGGGIVEGRIQQLALEAIETGKSGHFHFDLDNDISKKEAAICGGQISILVDAQVQNSIHVFRQLKESIIEKVPGVLITRLTINSGKPLLIDRYWITDTEKFSLPDIFIEKIKPVVKNLLAKRLRTGYNRLEFTIPGETNSSLFLLEPVFPPNQLVIAGAGHIGRALTHFGKILEFEVTVIDDRPEYANFENIKEADRIIVKNIGEAMQDLKKEKDTYVVIVTRGHNDDAAALKPCIGTELAYIGMIGSRNKVASMRKDFLDKGWTSAGQWDKIHAPIGLDIKSQTVDEIALSIAAELVLVRNSRENSILV
jgi:xanthine dehydrogenase accessory factor